MAINLLNAADVFTESIQKALGDASKYGLDAEWKIKHNTTDRDDYPQRVFGDCALVNLAEYRQKVVEAIEARTDANWELVWDISTMYTGLSKQMDFDFDWMTLNHKEAVFAAMDALVHAASQISELCYELTKIK